MKSLKEQLINEAWECRVKIDKKEDFDIFDDIIEMAENNQDLKKKYGDKKMEMFIYRMRLASNRPVQK